MTRDDIYDHLAQVYLGKKTKVEQKKKQQFNAWLVINILITVIIFSSSIYGLTAFLAHRGDSLQNHVIFSLNSRPIRINYNLVYPYPPVKSFSLEIPEVNTAKYKSLQFSVRGMDEGYPEVMRIEMRNHKNEVASVYIRGLQKDWRNINIPLADFQQITDWSDIAEVSFIFESWNIQKKKGIVLIDDVCFSS
jgi:hypothetical protein